MAAKKRATKKSKISGNKIKNTEGKGGSSENKGIGTVVTNCAFTGVNFDKAAVDAITTIAEGLIENAKALGQLAHVLKASNVNIEAMLKIAD